MTTTTDAATTQAWQLSMTQARAAGVGGAELVAACRARIAQAEPVVHAWARLAEEGPVSEGGPLGGAPFGVKDVIDSAELVTDSNSAIHAGRRPPEDAAAVALLRGAGGTLLGKTNTTELAVFTPGPATNPHDPTRTPGGSSSGSAAAVSAGMVPFALGTQTGGSVVRPSAFCGVVGYAAGRGQFPIRGMQPLSHALDTLGIHTREVADTILVRSALLGVRPAPRPVDVRRVAVWRAPGVDDAMLAALDATAEAMGDGGAEVRVVDLDAIAAELLELHIVVMDFDVARTLAWEDDRRELLSARLVEIIDHGLEISAEEVRAARERVDALGTELLAALGDAQAMLAPAALGPAPVGLHSTGSPDMNRPWHALGLPAITIPAGTTDEGLPLGVQLLSRRYADDDLLDLAAWTEALLPPAVRPW